MPTEYKKAQTDDSHTQKTICLCAGDLFAVWSAAGNDPGGANADSFHHKKLARWRNEIRGSTSNNTDYLYMYWRNGESDVFCYSKTENCTQLGGNYLAIAPDYENTAFFLQCPETTDSRVKAAMCIIGTHETAHTLGLLEVRYNDYGDYPGGNHDDETEGFTCVMESYQPAEILDLYYSILSGSTPAFCTYCAEKLFEHVYPNMD